MRWLFCSFPLLLLSLTTAAEAQELPAEPAGPTDVEAPSDAPATPACDGAALLLPGSDEPLRVELPAPCLDVAFTDSVVVVALGTAGAALVDPLADPPTPVLLPTLGAVVGVAIEADRILLRESVEVTRSVDASGQPLGSALGAPTIPDAPPEPVAPPPPEEAVGTVVALRGRRAVVELLPGAAPLLDDQVVTVRTPTTRTRMVGRVVVPGRSRKDRVVPVDLATDEGGLLLLGRGDVVRPGDEVVVGGPARRLSRRLIGPTPWRNQLGIDLTLVGGVSANVWSRGGHFMGRARVWYAAPVPVRFEISTEHLPVAAGEGAKPWAGGDLQGLVELDLPFFGVGVSGGYQWLHLNHSGPTVGALVRGGFRDGMHLEVRARFLPGAPNPFGGVEGQGVIPFSQGVGLVLQGGGGSQIGFARIGLRLHVFGQGGPGTLVLAPMVGMSLVGYQVLSDPDQPFSGTAYNQVGPSLGLGIELRPF